MEKVIFSDDFCRIFGEFMLVLLETEMTDNERSEILAAARYLCEISFYEGANQS